jgi:hypothetical protein
MTGKEKMQFMKFDYAQYVKYYNFGQQLLLNEKVPYFQKQAFLELVYNMLVVVKTDEQEKLLADSRKSLLNQISQLNPEMQRKSK